MFNADGGNQMIGPGKSGGEGFARHMNRNEWLLENDQGDPLPVVAPTVHAVLVATVVCCAGIAGLQAIR